MRSITREYKKLIFFEGEKVNCVYEWRSAKTSYVCAPDFSLKSCGERVIFSYDFALLKLFHQNDESVRSPHESSYFQQTLSSIVCIYDLFQRAANELAPRGNLFIPFYTSLSQHNTIQLKARSVLEEGKELDERSGLKAIKDN